ncbi:serine protease inhibitor 77Ba-like [Danaus plexippus]|uniref:serine protease inhibitor 77Ba-like n=1 Tax=Danaus plexippus TaxID=13037 RepID=UPI002AB1CC60|nr:serine protease inhibitor 77Ba-like [Danaus plexippus]
MFYVNSVCFMLIFSYALSQTTNCNDENALIAFKQPTYDFSVRILDKVATETGFHFVFSPFSTWWQLMTLAEGARGKTRSELWKVTRYHRVKCFRRKYKEIINAMDEELAYMTKRTNIVIMNKLLNVKKSYEDEARKSHANKILSLNFNNPVDSAIEANDFIETDVDGVITKTVTPEDFNMTVLMTTDLAYFKSDWLHAFNPVYTSVENFYKSSVPIGKVKLMTQMGYFNVTDVPIINARVVELPFNSNGRVSMLVFLPTKGYVEDLFYNLSYIRLTSIYNLFKAVGPKLLTVRIPRFKITTELQNIPELVYDMGVKRIFYPDLANFGGISDYKVHTSLMKQTTHIEVIEEGVNGEVEFLVRNDEQEIFSADRPFAYLIVDKKTDLILFAGMYTRPSVY